MYIIDQAYFIKELNIPNLNEMDSDTLNELNIDIDKYVRSLLQNTLGYELFKSLDSDIENGILKTGAAQKWKDFVNGKEYAKDSKIYKWKGLIFTEGTYKGSILAKFVYYHWLKDAISMLTGTGEKVINATNSINVSSNQNLIGIWNDFVKDYQGEMFCANYGNQYYHNNVLITDWLGSSDSNFVSLIQFLEDNKTDYPNATKTQYNTQNQLGL